MDYPKLIVWNQKEESISIQRVNKSPWIFQSLSDTKTKLGPDEVKKAAFNLIMVRHFAC